MLKDHEISAAFLGSILLAAFVTVVLFILWSPNNSTLRPQEKFCEDLDLVYNAPTNTCEFPAAPGTPGTIPRYLRP